MSNKPFKFKQFEVAQDRCAMKIGTDSVLLGSWITIPEQTFSILDVGAGTGVIALMMAQRSAAEVIDALEIDTDAYEQAVENFEASPWGDRLFCYHASFQEFFQEIDDQYDLIISNPPFFQPAQVSEEQMPESRQKARFSDALPFEHLMYGVGQLLSEEGKFAVIIPKTEEEHLIAIGKQVGLYPNRITRVKGTPQTEEKRSLIEFSFNETEIKKEVLIIEIDRHQYTPEYTALTQDFYLKM
ncbi:tRNA1(Val) (adenine(37)-N6)-methyltransferase [Aquimarina rhabdastrellae]